MLLMRPKTQTLLIAGALLAIGALATLQTYVFAAVRGDPGHLLSLAAWQFPLFLTWALLTPLVLALGRWVPVVRKRWIGPVAFHLVAGIAVCMLHTAGVMVLNQLFSPAAPNAPPPIDLYVRFFASRFQFLILIYWAILGTGYAIDYYHRYREREVAASKLEAQLVASRLEALKMQLHPHFLFNTLHAVGVLAEENPAGAKRMVAQLGDFLRHTMDNVSVHEVPLQRELEFLRLYLEIEQTRFQDRLTVSYDIEPETLSAAVPSFVLQPLVENAIKHGISKHAGEGRISITAARGDGDLELTVEDAGCARSIPPVDTWSEGVGLRTTRERLAQMYNGLQRVRFERGASGVRVTLRFPYRRVVAVAPEVEPAYG